MWDLVYYLLLVSLLAAAVVAGGLVIRSLLTGSSPAAALFGPRPDPRLDVVEQSSVDGRRRLILVRRDDVEHLIMIGGPVDVVIESGIETRRLRAVATPEPAPGAVYTRPPRSFGQAAQDM